MAAFAGDQQPIAAMKAIYSERRARMLALLGDIPGLRCTPPQGAFYVFANVAGLLGKRTPQGDIIDSDGDLVSYLLEHAGVALVGGAAYGMSPYVRLSFASGLDVIDEGCKRLKQAILRLR